MMDESLRDLYQDVILDHSKHPRHFGALGGRNPFGRRPQSALRGPVKIYLAVGADDRIADIKFEGRGCAISQASASLMTDMILGRTAAEAEKLMGGFLSLVKGEAVVDLQGEDREMLDVMAGVSAFPMRIKCATLAWHTMKSALEGGEAAKSE